MSADDRTRRRRSAALPWTVAAVAAVIALTALLAPRLGSTGDGDSGASGAAAGVPSTQPSDLYGDLAALARRQKGDPTARGRVDAPVVMIAYSDFQCPFCGKFARDTEPVLVRKYVDTGVLRIEWRDFPYLGPESKVAARAGRAAAAQGKFWQFHDAMYSRQLPPNSGRLTPAYLAGVADGIGLDVARFRKDMDGALADKLVRHDFNEGMSAGVSGTPSFLVNGRPIIGAMPLAEFEHTIETAHEAATR